MEVVEAKGGALLQRIQNEGEACPADVLITVDAGNLGLQMRQASYKPSNQTALAAVPAKYRHPKATGSALAFAAVLWSTPQPG